MDRWILSEVISSQARFRVLQVLTLVADGMSLRELERATELKIRSVQVATQGLLQKNILKKDKQGRFQLNRGSTTFTQLRKLFVFLRDEPVRENAKKLLNRAKEVIELSDEVSILVNRGSKKS